MADKIETLNKRLTEARDKFIELKECGIDEEILETYLQSKTKLSRKNVRLVIDNLDNFYNKLIKTEILERLKKNDKN